jgi:hypothetical protein
VVRVIKTPALVAGDIQHVELANQVAEDDRAVARHRTVLCRASNASPARDRLPRSVTMAGKTKERPGGLVGQFE